MALEFKITGVRRLQNKFRDMSRLLSSGLRVANKKAAIVVDRWIQKNFNVQGGLHEETKYGPWKPLAASTIKKRRKGSSTILQDTGRLKNSFDYVVDDSQAIVRSRSSYAKYHENGTARTPQRKIFPTAKQAEGLVAPIYEQFVEGVVNKT